MSDNYRIQSHSICLQGSADSGLCLRPLQDEDFPCLKKWNEDKEIIKWVEVCEDRVLSEEEIWKIYENASRKALCFLIVKNECAIGECWLQMVEIPELVTLFPGKKLVRIDLLIGEKEYWCQGIGSLVISLLTAYVQQNMDYDLIIALMRSDNVRCIKAFEKNHFRFWMEGALPQEGAGTKNFCLYIKDAKI